jgi:hypothetical protein
MVLGQLFEEADSVQNHVLGTRIFCEDGTEYMYVRGNGVVAGQGYVCGVDASYDATELTTAIAADFNVDIGICAVNAATADNDYFWLCMTKPAGNTELGVWTLVSCAADTGVYTSGTDGAIDDVATSQSLLQGIRLLTAQVTTAASMLTASEWKNIHVTIA